MQIDDLPPLRDIIATHGLDAKKSLGQNFLLDLNLTSKIARLAGDISGCRPTNKQYCNRPPSKQDAQPACSATGSMGRGSDRSKQSAISLPLVVRAGMQMEIASCQKNRGAVVCSVLWSRWAPTYLVYFILDIVVTREDC